MKKSQRQIFWQVRPQFCEWTPLEVNERIVLVIWLNFNLVKVTAKSPQQRSLVVGTVRHSDTSAACDLLCSSTGTARQERPGRQGFVRGMLLHL